MLSEDFDEGFVVEGEQHVRVAQGEHAGLVEAVDSSSSLPLDWMVAALCPRVESGATVHCLPS